MTFSVIFTEDAIRDLEHIDDYISEHDSPQNADYVLKQIEEVVLTLSDLPDHGTYPKELSTLARILHEFR